MLFHRVKVRPGKAMAFGVREGRPVFALPGNPVSAMLTFEEFVAPALRRMMGQRESRSRLSRPMLQAPLRKARGYTVAGADTTGVRGRPLSGLQRRQAGYRPGAHHGGGQRRGHAAAQSARSLPQVKRFTVHRLYALSGVNESDNL